MVEPINPRHLDPADPHYSHSPDEPVLERIAIAIEGEDCDECVRKLREPLMRIPGVRDVRVNTRRERVIVTFDARKTRPPDLHDAILASGYKPAPFADD
jgi:copper chaperone CopZ